MWIAIEKDCHEVLSLTTVKIHYTGAGTATLQVTIHNGAAGDIVLLSVDAGALDLPAGRAEADASGVVAFDDLAAGDYTVRVLGAADGSAEATAAVADSGAATVEVTVSPDSSVTGTVTDAGGPVARPGAGKNRLSLSGLAVSSAFGRRS